jgi:hypothetical protein
MYRFGGWDVRMTSIFDVLSKYGVGGHLNRAKFFRLFPVIFVTFPDRF